MSFDVVAESLSLVHDGFPEEPAPMTRRHRFEPIALDVAADTAMTLFLTRSRRRQWLTYCVLRQSHGEWAVVRSGRSRADRPPVRASGPAVWPDGPRYLMSLETSAEPGVRWMIGQVAAGAAAVRVDGRSVIVRDPGWFVLVSVNDSRGDFEILNAHDEVIGFHQRRTRPPWKSAGPLESLRRRRQKRSLGRTAQ